MKILHQLFALLWKTSGMAQSVTNSFSAGRGGGISTLSRLCMGATNLVKLNKFTVKTPKVLMSDLL